MKKHFYIIGLSLLFLLISPINCTAWSNGSYAYTSTSYDYNTDFGTHDWIAYNSLKILIDNGYDLSWLQDRQEIYLLGTEAPDNSGISIILDGTTITGFGDTTWHHVYYNEDGSIKNNEDDSSIRAKNMGDLANSYYDENKLDLASFYLGAMTHYIADLSMYAHTSENNVFPHFVNFDEHHSTLEGYVQTRTNNYLNINEFFTLSNTFSFISKTPYENSNEIGWNTYKDPAPSETTIRNALWLHENFFTGWDLTSAQRSSQTNNTKTLYYDRIEECLNNAIQSCISSILYETGIVQSVPSFFAYIIISSSLFCITIIIIRNKKKFKKYF